MGLSGLYSVKPWFVRSLSGIQDRLVARGVSADALSYAAVAASSAAALSIVAGYTAHPWFWLLVPPLGVARLALNALDGAVARRTGTARSFGKVVIELCDRASDALFVLPLTIFLPPLLVVVALVVMSLVSTCGSLGEVVGRERLTSGPMGKADRIAVLAVAAVVAALTEAAVAPFGAALLLITLGGLLTIALRVRVLHVVAGGDRDVR